MPLYVESGPPRMFGDFREYPAGHFDDPENLEAAKREALQDYERNKVEALEAAGIRLGEPELLWHTNARLMRQPWFLCSMAWRAKEIVE